MSNVLKSAPRSESKKRLLYKNPITQSDIEMKHANEDDCGQHGESKRLAELERIKEQHVEDIKRLRHEAETIRSQIEQEKEEARKEIENWWGEKHEEAKDLARKAQQEGFDAGYRDGLKQAEEAYEQRLNELQHIIRQAYAEKERVIQSAEPFVLEVSVEIAQKIIGEEIRLDPKRLKQMIRQGLKQVQESGQVTIRVSEVYYPQILTFIEELEQYALKAHIHLKVIPDPQSEEAGCMIETSTGSYDVRLSSQLSEIKHQLLSYMEECSAHEVKSG